MIVSGKVADSLKTLGARLREERLRRNETQQVFASRIGVSVPTLYKMEMEITGYSLATGPLHWTFSVEPKILIGCWRPRKTSLINTSGRKSPSVSALHARAANDLSHRGLDRSG